MDEFIIEIPQPDLSTAPRIDFSRINLPAPEINLPPIIFGTPNIDPKIFESSIKASSDKIRSLVSGLQEVRACRFDVASEWGNISEYVRAVTYRYKPQEITFVLKDLRSPSKGNPLFDWIHLLLYSKDNISVTTLDSNHLPVYENEFLGCRLKEHSCPMDYSSNDVATHHVTMTYEHVNINHLKRKECDA
jgi:hypothetical protein